MVTTWRTGKGFSELYLLRTYHHRKTANGASSRTNTGFSTVVVHPSEARGDNRVINYSAASKQEIWRVARAASAPPLFFEPIKLQIDNGEFLHEDGGLASTNNPTREAVMDVKEKGGWASIGSVISIGTSRRATADGPGAVKTSKRIIDRGADPEMVHQIVEDLSNREDSPFKYWRFNAGPKSNATLANIFDEWLPRSDTTEFSAGEKTVKDIEDSFNRWLRSERNRDALGNCAQYLVNIRRKRAKQNASRWERFATCHTFACKRLGCPSNTRDDPFYDRDRFEKHLVTAHRMRRDSPDFKHEVRSCETLWRYKTASVEH